MVITTLWFCKILQKILTIKITQKETTKFLNTKIEYSHPQRAGLVQIYQNIGFLTEITAQILLGVEFLIYKY